MSQVFSLKDALDVREGKKAPPRDSALMKLDVVEMSSNGISTDEISKSIIKSEQFYVDKVLYPVSIHMEERLFHMIDASQIDMKPSDLRLVFSNIRDIYLFHKDFSAKLLNASFQAAREESKLSEAVVDAFQDLLIHLDLYQVYVVEFRKSRAKLRDLVVDKQPLNRFAQVSEKLYGKNMETMLSGPVDRLAEYLELMELMRVKVVKNEKYKAKLEVVVRALRTTILDISRTIRETAKRENVKAIEGLFPGTNLVTPSRYLIKSDYLQMVDISDVKKVNKLIFVLFNDCLIFGTRKSMLTKAKIKEQYPLEQLSCRLLNKEVIKNVDFGVRISVETGESFVIIFNDISEQKEWSMLINIAIDNCRLKLDEDNPFDPSKGATIPENLEEVPEQVSNPTTFKPIEEKDCQKFKQRRLKRHDSFLPPSLVSDSAVDFGKGVRIALAKYLEYAQSDILTFLTEE